MINRLTGQEMDIDDWPDKNPDLMEKRTRYDFYMELRCAYQDGIDAINRIQAKYQTKGDAIMLDSLQKALILLDTRLDLLSSYDRKKFELRRSIDTIPLKAEDIQLGEREETARRERQERNQANKKA